MGDGTGIEWTDATWNPVLGCTKVSPGCDHCYAQRTVHRMAGNPNTKVAAAARGLTTRGPDGPEWTGAVNTLPNRLEQPLRWRRGRRIFVNSQADLFHDNVPEDFIAGVWAIMAATPEHTYQVLTKRHGRMRSLLSDPGFPDLVRDAWDELREEYPNRAADPVGWNWYPPPNVWLGVSVENQQWADIRIPALLDTPAAVRWISAEPLLGPVDLTRVATGNGDGRWSVLSDLGVPGTTSIDWVVAGGESGRGARPMHPDWARSLRGQCTAAGVPFLFKQWGEHAPRCTLALCGVSCTCDGNQRSHVVEMRRVGKKAAGRELDGRTWDEYPAVHSA